ncbi:MAG: permease [Candidatus Peribacteraceae bacterium]|nr:permease [Candidatus Peribacteraceae bacterium]MDD5740009.1 permease [Candidatus Peribacteraceae bacterium]
MDIFFPLQVAADWLAYGVLSLSSETHLGQAVDFFLYDTAKIIILVYIISILSGIVNFYLPVERIRDYLATHKLWGLDYFLATVFGAITPFCSCSSIPLFIGFLKAGIPLGVTFAYLISSPLISEIAFALMIGLFGIKIAILYVVAGSVIGMIGGFVIGRLKMEKYVEDFVWKASAAVSATETKRTGLREAFPGIVRESSSILWGILPYVLIGIGVGAAIHGFVPANFFEFILTRLGAFSLPVAVFVAVPMYANPAGVLPILESLVAKGVPIGTGLAFMMGVVGLSLPEALILKKVLKLPLLFAFFGIVTVGIILIGYLFNFLLA